MGKGNSPIGEVHSWADQFQERENKEVEICRWISLKLSSTLDPLRRSLCISRVQIPQFVRSWVCIQLTLEQLGGVNLRLTYSWPSISVNSTVYYCSIYY